MESGEMSKALATMQLCWPQPFKRSPIEDGRNMVFLGPRLAVHFVKGIDAEVTRADSELSRNGRDVGQPVVGGLVEGNHPQGRGMIPEGRQA